MQIQRIRCRGHDVWTGRWRVTGGAGSIKYFAWGLKTDLPWGKGYKGGRFGWVKTTNRGQVKLRKVSFEEKKGGKAGWC